MDAEDLNCTQFGTQFPKPNSTAANSSTFLSIITTVVSTYQPIHYYLYVSLVTFSVFANFTILVVLARKEMRSVGVNVTMMLIAVCDFSCSISAVLQQFLRSSDYYKSYFNAYARLTVDYLSLVFHALSLYLAVGMALGRAMALTASNINRDQWQNPKYALRIACIWWVPVFLIGSFSLFMNTVYETKELGVYTDVSELSLKNHCFFMKMSLIVNGVCFKALPCFLMVCFSLFFLGKIEEGQKRSTTIMSNQREKNTQIERSSRFIQFVLVMFVITETPPAILSIIGGLFIIDYINYYQKFASILSTISIFNTTLSFIIYSSLSAKFRQLFVQIFIPQALLGRIYRRTSIVVQPKASTSLTV